MRSLTPWLRGKHCRQNGVLAIRHEDSPRAAGTSRNMTATLTKGMLFSLQVEVNWHCIADTLSVSIMSACARTAQHVLLSGLGLGSGLGSGLGLGLGTAHLLLG